MIRTGKLCTVLAMVVVVASCSSSNISTNRAPVADAGPDQQVVLGAAAVQLSGVGSFDADGDSLTYQWTLLSRPALSTAGLSVEGRAEQVQLDVDLAGIYVVGLVVSDGRLDSAQDVVQVRVAGNPCQVDADCEDDGLWCNGWLRCVAGFCREALPQCDDADVCTTDSCDEDADACVNLRVEIPGAEDIDQAGTCDDGLDNDCDALTDMGDPDCAACMGHGQCDDSNPCTDDLCVDGRCENTPGVGGTACDDGLFCTTDDVCDGAGACSGGARDCSGLDSQCTQGRCNEPTDECIADAANEGLGCDDGLHCFENEVCQAGSCVGTALSCSDGDVCTADACDEVNDSCTNTLVPIPGAEGPPESASCTDGQDNDCDRNVDLDDVDCQACQNDGDCNDFNTCTVNTCVGSICQTANQPDGTGCDDGQYCTDVDGCSAGVCGGTSRDCTGLNDDCNQGACNEGTDACEPQAINQGVVCDDGQYCVVDTTCNAGVCQGGGARDCSGAGDQCNSGVCDEPGDACVAQPDFDGQACDDGAYCNTGETCSGGACQGGGALDCSGAGDQCNTGVCDEVGDGCVAQPVAGDIPCEDGLFCTSDDACDGAGLCVAGPGTPCGSECSTLCDEANTECDPNAGGTPCSDDGNICTNDACDGAGFCAHPFNAGACDDGIFCNGSDSCAAGVCGTHAGDPCPDQVCHEAGQVCADNAVVTDPLGDGTAFAFVFKYRGRIWVGPKSTGAGAVNFEADGSDPVSVAFSFPRDNTGNSNDNSSATPYPAIGYSGCTADTHECGPDNEDGRGVFNAGSWAGEEWLWVTGARSGGDLDYAYFTRDADAVLDFSFLDMSAALGGQTRGVSASAVFNDRFYIGLPDTGGARPYFMMVPDPPSAPGMNATENGNGPCNPAIHDLCDLEGADMDEIGGSSATTIIDVIQGFNDRLYVANNGGIVRSTTNEPLDVDNFPAHWIPATPDAATYQAYNSIETVKTSGIEPADKAWPAMASFGGRLFAARNTVSGPQLLVCNPAKVSGPSPWTGEDCDPGDWSLVAPDESTGLLTNFDNANNTRLSLLLATANHLYIGFDNATSGLVVFRSSDPVVAVAADFEGESACSAADHPASCDGYGGNGFGDASNSRIFSAVVAAIGVKDYLYIITGDGVAAASLVLFGD